MCCLSSREDAGGRLPGAAVILPVNINAPARTLCTACLESRSERLDVVPAGIYHLGWLPTGGFSLCAVAHMEASGFDA